MVKRTKNVLDWRQDRGATKTEYVLIVFLIGAFVIGAVSLLGNNLRGLYSQADNNLAARDGLPSTSTAPVAKDRWGRTGSAISGRPGQNPSLQQPAALPHGPFFSNFRTPQARPGPHGARQIQTQNLTGLDPMIDYWIGRCNPLATLVRQVLADGWTFTWGTQNEGSWSEPDTKKIVVDSAFQNKPQNVLAIVAHESGHARNKDNVPVYSTDLDKDKFVSLSTQAMLNDEGEAILTEQEMAWAFFQSTGLRLVTAGNNASEYAAIFQRYRAHGDRQKAQKEISVLVSHELGSMSKNTYLEYWQDCFEKLYDNYASP